MNFKESKGCGTWKGLKGETGRGKLCNYNYNIKKLNKTKIKNSKTQAYVECRNILNLKS